MTILTHKNTSTQNNPLVSVGPAKKIQNPSREKNCSLPTRPLLAILVIVFAFAATACRKDLSELNINPDQPLSADPNYLYVYALQQGMGNYNSDVNLRQWSIMNWTMYLAARGGVEEGREYEMPSGKDAFWREQYTNTLSNTQIIIEMAAENPNMVNMKAAAEIWQVYIFQILTDLWGDIPYSEALKGMTGLVFSPSYDSQQDIYLQMINKVRDAVQSFDPSAGFFNPESDLIYNGNMMKWQTLGNSLMLRLATRINRVDPQTYATIVEELKNKPLIRSQQEAALFPYNSVHKNPLWETMYRNESVIQNNPSKFFADLVDSRNDPRASVFFQEAPLSFLPFIPKYKGIPNLLPNGHAAWDNYNLNQSLGIAGEWGDISQIGTWFLRNNTPGVIMNYAEVCFLLAEAALQGLWDEDPQSLLREGVRAHIEYINLFGDEEHQIPESEIHIFLLNLPQVTLEEVITQKWLSFAYEQGFEAFAEYRRTGFPVLTDYFGHAINQDIFPKRLPYPPSEQTLNRANYNKALINQGPDNEFTHLWWNNTLSH
ncbi:MAG: SusD/RagB family nutrient-binding outer membrane lipoprotein [Bacteroidetes bacterium]|nr:MAG: SusD/RagB family nutrient-binding outer membrane lipoprotein [Bacteroidota bacterium]